MTPQSHTTQQQQINASLWLSLSLLAPSNALRHSVAWVMRIGPFITAGSRSNSPAFLLLSLHSFSL